MLVTSNPTLATPNFASAQSTIRVAVVHEWLTAYAGSEKVVEQILRVFPNADLFCLVDYLPDQDRDFLQGKPVKTSFLQRLPFGKSLFRKLLWLLPSAIESLDLSKYDIVLSSSHAVAKGVITGPNQLHICYCHSPIRYAWDLQHEYLRQAKLTSGIKGLYSRGVLHYIRMWDVRTANGVDVFVANSRFIAKRIEKVYRRPATVIHPPVDTDSFGLRLEKENFYITVSRLVPYKRVDLIVKAFSRMPYRRLLIVGDGNPSDVCKVTPAANVEFLGYQPHEEMKQLLSRAKAFVFAAEEDFGISVVEAQACGTPVICLGRGGALDSVIPGKTGLFFKEQTAESLCEAVNLFETGEFDFDPVAIRAHSETFSLQKFRTLFRELVMAHWNIQDAARSLELEPVPKAIKPQIATAV